MTPRATVRLQLHADFTFDDALAVLPDHAALGISHLYLSPIFTARPGSTHGYDVIDFGSVNPALGGEDGLRRLAAAARQRGMGLVIDIVPNHMGVADRGNAWWQDVLRLGRGSAWAGYFDIDWEALGGKLLLPILGKQYGQALDDGELRLAVDGDALVLHYFDTVLPLSPDSLRDAGLSATADADALARFDAAEADGRERLHALLEAQHYRLAWWRMAADAIDWRRFFEINELAGLRVEREEVFTAVHALVFRLYREGVIDGVRVDHVDGLADPGGYCRTLRGQLEALHAGRPDGLVDGAPWIVVEKILAPHESLPGDWQVDGTTGYDFMNDVLALLTDPAGQQPLEALWALSTSQGAALRTGGFAQEARRARRLMLRENLASEFNALVRRLQRLAAADLATRDIAAPMIGRALAALLEHFTVYRTYTTGAGPRSAGDAKTMADAFAAARGSLRTADHAALDALDPWLGGLPMADPDLRTQQAAAIVKFQQLSSPLAAKAVEDTAFYRYAPLLALNEVGNDPERFALSPDDFHSRMAAAARSLPHRLLATATHDHKRGEDARLRIAALSQIPAAWAEAVSLWREAAASLHRPVAGHAAPSPADELMLVQTLVGAWPLDLQPHDTDGVRSLLERVAQWQEKSLREAKLHTSWIAPDEAYEAACRDYLFGLATVRCGNGSVLAAIARFALALAPAGALDGLVQALLRSTVPGVPDLYQGTDFWDWSLVDPDNRRPVDAAPRHAALLADAPLPTLLPAWHDGRIKQALLRKTLALRQQHAALFAHGSYRPLELVGAQADRAMAFLREHGGQGVLVVVPRLATPLLDPLAALPMVPPEAWDDTAVRLPPELLAATWTDALTGEARSATGSRLPLQTLLAQLPVALLSAQLPQPSLTLQAESAAEAATREVLAQAAAPAVAAEIDKAPAVGTVTPAAG